MTPAKRKRKPATNRSGPRPKAQSPRPKHPAVGDTVSWKPNRATVLLGKVIHAGKHTSRIAINGDNNDQITIDNRKLTIVGSADFSGRKP